MLKARHIVWRSLIDAEYDKRLFELEDDAAKSVERCGKCESELSRQHGKYKSVQGCIHGLTGERSIGE